MRAGVEGWVISMVGGSRYMDVTCEISYLCDKRN
jgi:hypothetical protein